MQDANRVLLDAGEKTTGIFFINLVTHIEGLCQVSLKVIYSFDKEITHIPNFLVKKPAL